MITQTVQWCIVHASAADDEVHCHWDRLAGPRPGRGACDVRPATVTCPTKAEMEEEELR